jgi:hypothetical protein
MGFGPMPVAQGSQWRFMHITTPTCPYCNAPVTIPAGAAVGQRLTCGRCGEAFSVRPAQKALAEEAAPAQAITAPPEPRLTLAQYRARFRGRNRAVGLIVLGMMVFMATVGLIFALSTQAERRANDRALKKRPHRPIPEEPQPGPVAPARLAGLGYLPKGTTVVLALHVAELERDKVGRQVLDQPLPVGRFALRPGQLAQWCGLPRGQVDHVVLGLSPDETLLARAVLIVRARQPYEARQVQAALGGEPVPAGGRKQLYRFNLPDLGLPAVIWCVDEYTLALALVPSHLDAVPDHPVEGLGALAEDVGPLIEQRVEPGAVLWLAGTFDDQMRKLIKVLAPHLQQATRERVLSVKSFAGWVQVQETLRAVAVLQMRDDKPAESLAEVVHAAAQPGLKASRDGAWVTIQYKTDWATWQGLLPP